VFAFVVPDGNNTTTETNYIDLTFDLGGTVWDLQQLRAGAAAESFSAAFVTTIEEIIEASFATTLVATDETVEFEILSETLTGRCHL
jgi:hypothetical protein